jgi:hypothetical protein
MNKFEVQVDNDIVTLKMTKEWYAFMRGYASGIELKEVMKERSIKKSIIKDWKSFTDFE